MSFKDLDIKISYSSYGNNQIIESFLVPVLKQTKLYRRSVGFFSSSVIDSIVDGIVGLSRNGGNIRLIASPKLEKEDIEAISLGYKKREDIINDAFNRNFIETIDELEDVKLQLLVSLIANRILDIKIVTTKDGTGMYHDKLGILDDYEGNTIVFYGSPNSSKTGYSINYEKVRVVKSWESSGAESVNDECMEFDNIWNGLNPFVKVYDYTESAEKNIITLLNNRKNKDNSKGNKPIVLRDYQEDAINAWVENGYKGFYVMATGTGKTWTAIYSAKKLVKSHESLIVICAPYKHLIKQWKEDVVKVFKDALIIMVSSENLNWEKKLTEAIIYQRYSKGKQIIVISTITSFYLERFQKAIRKSKQEKLLIVDEAHRFTKREKSLHKKFNYMLGLSATPFSGRNTAKGVELMKFFGGQVFDLPIEKALDRGFLVKYYYYPIYVNATLDEEERFKKLNAKIAGCFRDNICIDPDSLVLYLRARLRIISMAKEKISNIDNILNKINEKDHFIVYCGDGKVYDDNDEEIRHIQFVKRVLSKHGYKSSQFTASENMIERMDLVDSFNEGAIDSLVAIRCLDEGINIPSITSALILSSNDDYREFVQRRGRILRTYENKKYANIYDVIVLPLNEVKMAEIELRRFYEYARLAENYDELLKDLYSIAAGYGLELENFITTFDDKEDRLDE